MTVRLSLSSVAVLALLATTAAGAAGCGGSIPPPNDELSAAQTDIGRAEAGAAPPNPEAQPHPQPPAEDLPKAQAQVGQDNKRAATPAPLPPAGARPSPNP